MEPDLVMVRMGKGEVLPAAEEGAEGGRYKWGLRGQEGGMRCRNSGRGGRSISRAAC